MSLLIDNKEREIPLYKNKWVYVGLGVLILSILSLGLLLYIQKDSPEKITEEPLQKEAEVGGALIMNLQNKDSDTTGLFSYDFVQGVFERSPFNYYMPTLSHDEKMLLGSGITATSGEVALFLAREGVVGDAIVYASSTIKTPFWNAQLSPSRDLYTFEVASAEVDDDAFYLPSNWHIYLVSSTSKPRAIALGHEAQFAPDGSRLLYKADDGLHLYTIADGTDELVVPLPTDPSILSMFDVSKDGTMLAGTDPLTGIIVVVPIISWEPFVLGEITQYQKQAFWPVFSPDNQWLAFESVDWDVTAKTEAKNKKLMLLNIASGTFEVKADLNAYPQKSISISDWVINK